MHVDANLFRRELGEDDLVKGWIEAESVDPGLILRRNFDLILADPPSDFAQDLIGKVEACDWIPFGRPAPHESRHLERLVVANLPDNPSTVSKSYNEPLHAQEKRLEIEA